MTYPANFPHFPHRACIRRTTMAFITVLTGIFIASCGGDNGTVGTSGITVYPVGAASYDSSRIYIPVTAVGSQPVSAMPLVLDTGSAGVTLNALKLFPPDMVSGDGFVFPPGQKGLSYNGMTVTNVRMFKTFGNADGGTAQIGNLGFAPLTFGARGEVTTGTTPVLFYFTIQTTANGYPNGVTISPPHYQGILGINSSANTVHVADSVAPSALSVCTPQSTASCHLVSPLRYLKYPAGIDAGFALSPATLQNCDISVAGSCTPVPLLTIGLSSSSQSGFGTQQLACPGIAPGGSFNGLPICESNVKASITSGNAGYSGKVQFDTGTPMEIIHVHHGVDGFVSPPAEGTPYSISPTNGFSYTFKAGTGTTATSVILDSTERSVVGIDFFTSHSFFINYLTTTEGWK